MSTLSRFYQYVQDFEVAVLSDDWSLLDQHFTDDARHISRNSGPMDCDDRGRPAVVVGLRNLVDNFDRRCDARIPEIVEGPTLDGDAVWMTFLLTLRRAGLPDLALRGRHGAIYRGDQIECLDETLLGDSGAHCSAFFDQNAERLRAPASPFSEAALVEHGHALQKATGRSLVRCYGAAKSEQDIGAALTVCHPEFVLSTEAFGLSSGNRQETADQLALFFSIFPDYHVELESIAGDEAQQVCWGRAIMTFGGEMFGIAPTGKTANIAFCSVFDLEGPSLRRERFFIDLADLCRQIDAPLETVSALVADMRSSSAA